MADMPDGWHLHSTGRWRWRRWAVHHPSGPIISGLRSEAEAARFATALARLEKAAAEKPPVVDEATRLQLHPDDRVLLRTDHHVSDVKFASLTEQWRHELPHNRVMLLEGGLRLEGVLAP